MQPKKRHRVIDTSQTAQLREASPGIEEQPELCHDEIDETHSVLSVELPGRTGTDVLANL